MKKLLSVIACVVCAAVFASIAFAAENPDAHAIYKRATRYIDEAQSVEMTSSAKTIVTIDAEPDEPILQQSRMTIINPSSEDVQLAMHTVMSRVGDNSAPDYIDIYYKDGYMYTSGAGQKFKLKADIAEMTAKASQLETALEAEAFKNAVVEKTDTGTRIDFTINLSDYEGADSAIIKELSKLAGDTKLTFGKIDYSVMIGRDNKLKSYDVFFDMEIAVDGKTVCTQTKASYLVISVNRVGGIDFPADLVAYKKL